MIKEKNIYKILVKILLIVMFFCTFNSAAYTQVVYTLNTTSNYTVFTDGGDVFDNVGAELGMWANTGNKQVVAWRQFQTVGDNTGSARSLQVGDIFTISLYATSAIGSMGFSLNASPSTGSWANRYSNSRLYIQADGTTGSWYVNSNAGNESLNHNVSSTGRNYVFTIRITSETTADIELVVDGTTTKRLMNVTMNGTAGTNITHFVLYLNDDWNGTSNSNIYWKQTTQHESTGVVNLGYYLASGTYTPGLVKNGLTSNSTSTSNTNNVYVGGDSGSSVVLSNANTYSGTTTVNTNATLKLGVSSASASSGPLGTTTGGTTVSSGGVIDMNGYSLTSSATEPLTLNGTGISFGGALVNSSATASTWAGNITLNSLSAIGGTGDITVSGVISGANDLEKLGSGTLSLSGDNTYTGSTKIYAGTLEIAAADRISNSSDILLTGGTLSTGSTTGYDETVGTLQLEENSTIDLGTGSHSLTFSASNGVSWTSGKTLTITGWAGGSGTSGTAGKIFVGSDATGLTEDQLSQITFAGIGEAKILSTGEIVPKGVFQSRITGNWNVAGTWEVYNGSGYVITTAYPTKDESTVTIKNTHTVTLTADATLTNLIVETGGALNLTDKNLSIAKDCSLTNNGTINSGTSTVVFEGTATIGGTQTTTFNDVTINGGIDFGSSKSIINGTLTINTGSFVNLNAPIYGSSSTLKYNSGGVYERRVEWDNVRTAGTTPGHPVNVLIANNTTIDYPNTGTNAFTTDLEIAGNLTIDAGSQLIMAYGYNNNKSGSLTIGGDLIINGNLGLGDAINGDIILKGDWIRNSGSNLYLNQRAIFFTGSAEQSINSDGGETFEYVILDNGNNLNLLSDVTIKEKLEMVSGNITTNANILEIGTSTSDPGLLDYTSGMVLGTIKRWFPTNTNSGDQTGIFPLGVGSDFRPLVVEYSTAPTVGGTLTASFVESSMGWQNSGSSPTIAAVGTCDAFSVTNYSDQGYWQIDDADGLSGGIYDISLYANGFTTINDICQLTALKRVGAGLWESVGQHQQPNISGTHGLQVKRRLVSGWSNWGLASGKDNILPVELIEFTHECYPNQTTIFWTTASEKNNKHFEIEKSFDAYNWESIAKVDGAGNSNTKTFYSFADPASFDSDKLVYYRLKQTDFDGTYSYSNTISANCNSKIEPFSVYPNPNNGNFTITTSNPQNRIKIFDTSGKVLFDQFNHEKHEIEIEGLDLNHGVYFLNIIFDNTTYTKKIVVRGY